MSPVHPEGPDAGAAHSPAAPAALAPEQTAALETASAELRTLLRPARVATVNGWTIGVFGVLSILWGLLAGAWGVIVGAALVGVAWNELRGRDRLRALDPEGARILGRNQWILACVSHGDEQGPTRRVRMEARDLYLPIVAILSMGSSCAPRAASGNLQTRPPVQYETGYFQGQGGVRLFFRRTDGAGEPVVVVHGGPGLHSGYLHPDLSPMTPGRTVVYYDQRGGGRSELDIATSELTAERHVQDLEALRISMGAERISLVGHSWGALLVGLYAAAHPERVRRLIVIGGDPPVREPLWSEIDPTAGLDDDEREELEQLAGWWTTGRRESCRRFWWLFLKPRFADPADRGRMKGDLCDAPPEAFEDLGRAEAARLSLGSWDLRERLSHVDAPALIVHGAGDVTPVAAALEWARALPKARILVVPDAGHFPHVERPDVFFPAVGAFLDGRWPPGARRVGGWR